MYAAVRSALSRRRSPSTCTRSVRTFHMEMRPMQSATAGPALMSNSTVSADNSNPNPRLRDPYWRVIPMWKDVTEAEFLSYRWQVRA